MKIINPTTYRLTFLAAALSAFIASCSGPEIKTAVDPQADFTRYRTYSWANQTASPDKPNAAILDETVKAEVDKQLAAKGLHEVTDRTGDLQIAYTAMTKVGVTYGPPPGPYWYGPGEVGYPTRKGTLTLIFRDPRENRVVWQGSATDVIGDSGASQDQVADAVKDLIQRFPPA